MQSKITDWRNSGSLIETSNKRWRGRNSSKSGGQDIQRVCKKKKLLEKKTITNNCLLGEKDNILNLLER